MKPVFCIFLLFFSASFCMGQYPAANTNPFVKGKIVNYSDKPLALYKSGIYPEKGGRDTLVFIDSVRTNKKGEFVFNLSANSWKQHAGLYKIQMLQNQFFFIIYSGNEKAIEIKTVYQPDMFNNNATDSLLVLTSEENKLFYEFQALQKKINIADAWLLQMMRLYPLSDPFHKKLTTEYFERHQAMELFVNKTSSVKNLSGLITKAYYKPVNPDWREPDNWRDSIIAAHYFDYFNPADSFYLHTNILTEKLEIYLKLKTNKLDGYGQPIKSELLYAYAAKEFLNHATDPNNATLGGSFNFCFNYLLTKFSKEHLDNAFLFLYDSYAKPQEGNCESSIIISPALKEKANKLRNVAIGSSAPDFVIMDGKINLQQLPATEVLILFWASWCPHCADEIPKIKAALEQSKQNIMVVAVSLDTDTKQWEQFVEKNAMANWVNITDFKSWNGSIPKQYNVYATPSMFLLDKNKKIIAKPETTNQLIKAIEVL